MECWKGSSLVQCAGDGKGESEDRCSGTDEIQVAGHKAQRRWKLFVHYSNLVLHYITLYLLFSFLSQCFWRRANNDVSMLSKMFFFSLIWLIYH